ncbi:Glycosyl transferases group 1 [compost metagenome]
MIFKKRSSGDRAKILVDESLDGFDAEYYARSYAELRGLGGDLIRHYIKVGWVEGRNPSADFDTFYYRRVVSGATHPDLCPLVHYRDYGAATKAPRNRVEALEGASFAIDANALINALPELREEFDEAYYVERYADLKIGQASPLEHFIRVGWRRGANPSARFDTLFYRERFMYRDDSLCPLEHYVRFGRKAGLPTTAVEAARRKTAVLAGQQDVSIARMAGLDGETIAALLEPYFDAPFYLQGNGDVAKAQVEPYWHYIHYGHNEGRVPNPRFDPAWYAKRYMTGKDARGLNPLLHYAIVGRLCDLPLSEPGAVPPRVSMEDSIWGDWLQEFLRRIGVNMKIFDGGKVRRYVLPLFSVARYRAAAGLDESVSDVAALLRYISVDFPGGMSPGPFFDGKHYQAEVLRLNLPPLQAGVTPFHHWLLHGVQAGASPNPAFNGAEYLALNRDLAKYPGTPLEHFLLHGLSEGRRFNRLTGVAASHAMQRAGRKGARANDFCEVAGCGGDDALGILPMKHFMESGRLERTINEAAEIEPDIRGLDANMVSMIPPWHDGPWADYEQVLKVLPQGRFDSVVLMPFCKLGGADFVAGVLATQLNRSGRVLVIRTDAGDWARPDWFPEGVETVDLSPLLGPIPKAMRMRTLYEVLLRVEARDIYNVNSRLAFDTFVKYGERLATITRIYAYYFCADRTADGVETGYPIWYFSNILPYLSGALIDNATLAQQLIDRFCLTGKFHDKVRVLYTPVMSPPNEATVAVAQCASSARRGRKRILWAGRLDVQKRFDLLVNVARLLPDIDFVGWGTAVLSSPPDMSALPSNLTVNPPFQSYDELPLTDADGWFYTSAWDGIPTILIELGSMGLPIVASAAGGVPELIDETTGWCVPADAPAETYAEAIREMLALPEERVRRAAALQQRVRQQHSREAYSTTLGELSGQVGVETGNG